MGIATLKPCSQSSQIPMDIQAIQNGPTGVTTERRNYESITNGPNDQDENMSPAVQHLAKYQKQTISWETNNVYDDLKSVMASISEQRLRDELRQVITEAQQAFYDNRERVKNEEQREKGTKQEAKRKKK